MVKHCTIGLKKTQFHLTFEYDLLLLAFTVKILKAYHNIKNGIFMSRDKMVIPLRELSPILVGHCTLV